MDGTFNQNWYWNCLNSCLFNKECIIYGIISSWKKQSHDFLSRLLSICIKENSFDLFPWPLQLCRYLSVQNGIFFTRFGDSASLRCNSANKWILPSTRYCSIAFLRFNLLCTSEMIYRAEIMKPIKFRITSDIDGTDRPTYGEVDAFNIYFFSF